MSEHYALHLTARDTAHAVLADRRSALVEAGLRARIELERHFEDGRESWSEIRVDFWRGDAFVDVLETFLVREGEAVVTPEELKAWLEEHIDAILEENAGR
jgi:hypothetical protein